MNKKILRNYLEIKSLKDLSSVKKPSENYLVTKIINKDFQLNKFLYKQVGKEHHWIDRLNWTDKEWMNYLSQKNFFTFVLKYNEDIAGYFEFLYHEEELEVEILYFGLLKEYIGKKLGGYLLSEAIKESFKFNIKRTWVHTCSLDHVNALNNYKARGMIIFKTETLEV